jgi:transposase
MKKHTTGKKSPKELSKERRKQIRKKAAKQRLTVGLDLGDRSSHYCILDEAGEVVSEGQLPTTTTGLSSLLGKLPASRVVMEVGTHSPWVSRHVAKMGHEVMVGNSHKLKLITQSVRKNDRVDARLLARLGRLDPQLLSPIQHRGKEAQADLAVIRARAELVEARTGLINCARGLAKPMGERLNKCEADKVTEGLAAGLSAEVRTAIGPVLKSVEALSAQIAACDATIEEIAQRYPEVKLLTQVKGVGTLIGLTFILTIEDAQRFQHSRDVGPFLGMQPKQRDSGNSQPQLGISKTEDRLLRTLLVQGAHCILRKRAPDSDLQAWGRAKMLSGGKNAKRRTIVAVARKLGVLLHRLWVTGEVYDPLHNRKAVQLAQAVAKAKAQARNRAA